MSRILIALFLGFSLSLHAQDDLMDLFDDGETTDYTYATFKTTRIINSQSIENPASKNLLFIVSHQFGRINEGTYELFGLDKATMRLGFEYGITDWLAVGIGRSTLNKTYDGSVKLKVLRQSSGLKSMPVSLSYFTNMAVNSLKWSDPERKNYFSSRLQYLHQLLIARKINNDLSVQITPSLIHRNLVEKSNNQNDVFAIGVGGRYKLSQRMSLNIEYFYLLPGETADSYDNSFSVGIDIETGGHVFQLYLTNSQGMIDEYFIANTTGNWFDGDMHFGFNINRTFSF